TTTCAPAARSASTGAPPGSSSSARWVTPSPVATPTSARTTTATATGCAWDDRPPHRRPRQGVLSGQDDGIQAPAQGAGAGVREEPARHGAEFAGLELDLPARVDLPEGLHRQPPEPVLRDHEQRPLPPPPGEGEEARGEGQLHALPGRAELLPVHPADGHRHLPDVLLPADRGAGLGRHLHA